GHGLAEASVTVVNRQRTGQGTFPNEIVTCRCDNGYELRLFCKYGCNRLSHNCYGHRGGVAYEAAVYGHVLKPLKATTPMVYGTHTGTKTGETWLILEYLDEGMRVTHSTEPTAMDLAVNWIGRFHTANEARLARDPLPVLNRYNAEYYLGWAHRT